MTNHPLTCLVVEDSKTDRFLLGRMLNKLEPDLRLVMVTTLQEARRSLAGGNIDFVILDNSLPDGNGADFVMDLSEDARFDGVPVLIVTEWPSPFIFAKAKMAHVKHVFAKDQLRDVATLGLIKDCIAAAKRARNGGAPEQHPLTVPITDRDRARQRRDH